MEEIDFYWIFQNYEKINLKIFVFHTDFLIELVISQKLISFFIL